jgi:putative colanic acid biosynthesis acetyltransferase WcaF
LDQKDAYLKPSFSFSNRLRRMLWAITYSLLFRPSPRFCHAWRAWLLQLFGSELGTNCHIYSNCQIWAPWNLVCGDVVAIADGAIIYNPALISLGSHSVVSQEAYLCGATHDFNDAAFPLLSATISLGAYSWVCARATVLMGVTLGEGAVLGLGSIATKDLEPWTLYAGMPAKKIGDRARNENSHHEN